MKCYFTLGFSLDIIKYSKIFKLRANIIYRTFIFNCIKVEFLYFHIFSRHVFSSLHANTFNRILLDSFIWLPLISCLHDIKNTRERRRRCIKSRKCWHDIYNIVSRVIKKIFSVNERKCFQFKFHYVTRLKRKWIMVHLWEIINYQAKYNITISITKVKNKFINIHFFSIITRLLQMLYHWIFFLLLLFLIFVHVWFIISVDIL